MQLLTEHLTKRFERVTALEDVSFTIEKGTFTSVIGPSGAGKTTLFRLLSGAESPDEGEIRILGMPFSGLKGREKKEIQKKIGMIYQDFCLVENVSCLQNVLHACLPDMHFLPAMAGRFGKAQKEEALRMLERVGLEEKAGTPVLKLSGGQKQRVAIARALMRHPQILLADEPAASLDPVTGRQILELLKDLQEKDGVTVLMNSHNLAFSLEYSDRLLGLREGRLVYDGGREALSEAELKRIYGEAALNLETEKNGRPS